VNSLITGTLVGWKCAAHLREW